MTETLDTYTAGTSEADFAEADLPDIDAGQDVSELPRWGFTVDPKTGEERPKKAPGRPKKPAGAEELAAGPPVAREPDRPPQRPKGRRPRTTVPDDGPPMPRGGVIAAGINKAYRNAGKLIRGWENGDPQGIGQAFIDCTKVDPDEPEDERNPTVGEAWEQLARSNPRIRAFLLKVIAGGEYGDLLIAHLPIGIALVGKSWFQRWFKPGAVLESFAEPDEDEPDGTALPGGLTSGDLGEMQDLAMAQARKIAARSGMHVSEEELAAAAAKAKAMAEDGVPPAFRRVQPKRQTRAQRTGTR